MQAHHRRHKSRSGKPSGCYRVTIFPRTERGPSPVALFRARPRAVPGLYSPKNNLAHGLVHIGWFSSPAGVSGFSSIKWKKNLRYGQNVMNLPCPRSCVVFTYTFNPHRKVDFIIIFRVTNVKNGLREVKYLSKVEWPTVLICLGLFWFEHWKSRVFGNPQSQTAWSGWSCYKVTWLVSGELVNIWGRRLFVKLLTKIITTKIWYNYILK